MGGVTAAFESDWGTPTVTPDEPMVLCDTAVATPPGTMANLRFRRPDSDGTESSILVDILVAGSDADAAGWLQELGANLGACRDYDLPDIGAEGVMQAGQSTFVGREGIRWSTEVVSTTPGARFWEGFITTSGPLLVQVMTEVRTVFDASVVNLADPVALLEQVVPAVFASVE
ncbi:MAG TPA: hypothetical protein VMM81_03140 [Acidimicrobiia bacterium]|nr:hypothetical protein [Acidimicrobiia bacterium]